MASKIESDHLTVLDPLTGLTGEGDLAATLGRWRSAADAGTAAPVHAMAIALGRFDSVNLAYGEAAGDGALAEVARRIRTLAADELAPGEWIAVRVGGGKFVLAAREAISRERWQWLGEALADALTAPIAASGGAGTVRLWPRVALSRVLPGERPAHVLEQLGATLDRASDRSGSRLLWADRLRMPGGIQTAELEADLLAALDRDEIEVVYQPQYNLVDDTLRGAEALARWRHPKVGLIGASVLFSIAERVDHVAHLSRHIAELALHEASCWPGTMHLSLNVTPHDLASGGFADQFAAHVGDSGFDPRRLTLEITEQVLLGDLEQAAAALGQLRASGIRVALDDFGGGFCNFRYLKMLPLDALKLDRSMLTGVEADPRDQAVLRAIAAMAEALGLSIVAEGVETDGQRAIVAELGCSLYQGFLRSAPVSADDFLILAKTG